MNKYVLKTAAIVLSVFAVCAVCAVCAVFTSCQKPQDGVKAPVITIPSMYIFVTAEAGTQRLAYTIENKTNHKLSASSNADWLYAEVSDKDVAISYQANESSEAAREATLTLSYPGATPVELAIKQEKAGAAEATFELIIKSTDIYDYEFLISPQDKEMIYNYNISPKAFVDSFASDNEFMEYDLTFWKEVAANEGFSFAELMQMVSVVGDFTINAKETYSILDPDTEYYVYVYGLKNVYVTPCTGITKVAFTTDSFRKTTIDFNFEINGLEITVDPTPEYIDYYFDCLPVYYLTGFEGGVDAAVEDYWNYYLTSSIEVGWPLDVFLMNNRTYGKDSYDFTNDYLELDTDYVAFAFGVNNSGVINSNIEYSDVFHTPDIANAPSSTKVLRKRSMKEDKLDKRLRKDVYSSRGK